MKFSIILAVDEKNGLGKNNSLAWSISKDMKYFKQITTQVQNNENSNALIMGRKTWDSIPEKFRPLIGRFNCILTRNQDNESRDSNVEYFQSLEKCLEFLDKKSKIENVYIIGGSQLYNSVLDNPDLDKVYVTNVKGDFGCDVFFDGVPDDFELISETEYEKEKDYEFNFCVYKKNN